jgi:hypothetical protein
MPAFTNMRITWKGRLFLWLTDQEWVRRSKTVQDFVLWVFIGRRLIKAQDNRKTGGGDDAQGV